MRPRIKDFVLDGNWNVIYTRTLGVPSDRHHCRLFDPEGEPRGCPMFSKKRAREIVLKNTSTGHIPLEQEGRLIEQCNRMSLSLLPEEDPSWANEALEQVRAFQPEWRPGESVVA